MQGTKEIQKPNTLTKIEQENNRKRKLEIFDFIQQVFCLQVCTQPHLRLKNIVWVCTEDFDVLFPGVLDSSIDESRYIQIAKDIYRVGVATLKIGCMAISDFQFKEMNPSLFKGAQNQDQVTVIPFDPKCCKIFSVQKMRVTITENDLLRRRENKIVLFAPQFKEAIKKKINSEYLIKNKAFCLGFEWGEVSLRIDSLFPENVYKDGYLSYGVIRNVTGIELNAPQGSQLLFVDRCYKEEVQQLEFKVTLVKRSFVLSLDQLPLSISVEELEEQLRFKIGNEIVCKDYTVLLQGPSGWDIQVNFQKGILKEGTKHKSFFENLLDGYMIHKKLNLFFEADPSEIILKKGASTAPDIVIFDIVGVSMRPSLSKINQDKERWLNVMELQNRLISEKRLLSLHQNFEIDLSSGTFVVHVSGVKCEKNLWSILRYETEWKINNKTEVIVTASNKLNINLIKDGVFSIKKASFQLSLPFQYRNEEILNFSIDQLKNLLKTQGPKTLVKNQIILLQTEQKMKIELQLIDVEFSEELDCSGSLTAMGEIDKTTKFEFVVKEANNVNIIETIPPSEIEALHFELALVQKKSAPKVSLLPLVENFESFIVKLRKKTKNQKFLLMGSCFSIPIGEGWNAEVRLCRGSVKLNSQIEIEDNRFAKNLYKRAFCINDQTFFSIIECSDVIWVQNETVAASAMHIKVIKIVERGVKVGSNIIKVHKINIKELKKCLLGMKRPFARQEKFVVNLTTGKFVVEILNAKDEKFCSRAEGNKGTFHWSINKKIKLKLTVEKSLNIQQIKHEGSFVLRKARLSVRSVNFSGHISLKEKTILNAVKGLLPLEVFKKQNIIVAVKDDCLLSLEVEDMLYSNDNQNNDVLGLITAKTEVVFCEAKNSNIMIRTSPKIFNVEDPIKLLEEFGIGGMDKQFSKIRHILFSRSENLKKEVERRDAKPIKGILLYGPPGTGKTKLARSIGEMVGCSGERLIMMNAKEILNKWFCESEANIRKLFAPARLSEEKYGKKSPLYLIVIDEVDALLPTRGEFVNKNRETLVNQFLGEMDGLYKLNNVLVVGITNRKEEIDSAAFRHGRLGEHIKIDLPDKQGRFRIFTIHTKKLVEEKLLDKSVDLDALVNATENFSGADIEALIEDAKLFSIERLNSLKCSKEELKEHKDGLVTMQDFKNALKERKGKGNEILELYKSIYI